MTNRKTTNGYKVDIDIDQWQGDFWDYFDFDLCCKDVSRDYKLPNTLDLAELEIDYLLNQKTKEEIMDEYYTTETEIQKLDKLKEEKNLFDWAFTTIVRYDLIVMIGETVMTQ